MRRCCFLLSALLAFAASANPTHAQLSDNVVRIGVLNDGSGPYADLAGRGSVIAAQIAIEEHGGKALGKPIEVISADHQLKPDVGLAIVRRWFDLEGVDLVIDIVHSSIALAAQQLASERNRIVIGTAVGTTDFTGKACTANSAAWLYDTYALTNGLVRSMVEKKLDTWFLIAVDYAFGQSMEADARRAIEASGGKILGVVRHPLGTSDFSSFLLQAQASGAKAILLANGGGDLINAVKQAKEYNLMGRGQALATPLVFLTDVKSLGLPSAQGLNFTTPFYWDRNEETRAWSKRFFDRHGAMPTMVHASVYSAVRHYLKAIEAAGTDGAGQVMMKMRSLPVDDMYVKGGQLREDGRLVHPMYLVRVKTPAESSREWDYYHVLSEIPGELVFKPAAESGCPLVGSTKRQ